MRNGKIRIGIVGMGKMGLVHSGILTVLPNVELVAVCEKNGMIRRFVKKLLKNLDVVDDLQKLKEFDLDAIYVTTPIPSHFPISKAILEQNLSKSLFVEKTLANTYDEAKSLVDLAQHDECINMVGYLRRFYVTFSKAKELLEDNAIGELESFQAYAYSSDFLGLETEKASDFRGGVLRDLGCHAIDLALWFFGDFAANSGRVALNDRAKDGVNFMVESPRIRGDFGVSWAKENFRLPEVGFSVTGSDGKLIVNDDQIKLARLNGETFQWFRHDLNDTVPFWLGLPEYYREDSCFVESLRCKTRAAPDFGSAAKVDKIIEEVVGLG